MFTLIYILSFVLSMIIFIGEEKTYWGLPTHTLIRITVFSLIPAFNTFMVVWWLFDSYTKYKELKK